MDRVACVVIGAGVIGLAVARQLALSGREVVIVEREPVIGSVTSARNSEVIHAGIYYPAGSAKAALCVAGRRMLYEYCAARQVPHRRCGKLIVATDRAQVGELDAIRSRAAANGVDDLALLSRSEAMALEPGLHCEAALLSPATGIIDSHALMVALLGDAEASGAVLALNSSVVRGEATSGGIVLEIAGADGAATILRAQSVINAAGLFAPALAQRIAGLDSAFVPTAYFAKGSYFALVGRAPFARLVYPVPATGGLGVHLTLDLAGQARFGPDVEWLRITGTEAIRYEVDPQRAAAFYPEIRKYWPGLPDAALLPAYSGVRAKLAPAGRETDFVIQGPHQHGVAGLVNLFGIESPGLTSCLAIAEAVAACLDS